MRLSALVVAAFVVSGPAAAQSWTEYAYPEYNFAVSFPAAPRTETVTYQAPDGRAVEAHVYAATLDHAAFKMTIVDFADPALQENAVIANAVKLLSDGREIKVDIPARINRVYGRQLSMVGPDGSHSSAAVFYHRGRLYQIEGKVIPPDSDSAAIRFQQSLVFTGRDSNRAADAGEPRRRCRDARAADAQGAAAAADGQLANEARCRGGREGRREYQPQNQ